jgi:TonB family protein
MPVKINSERATFGLLPEPERSAGSFFTSIAINGLMLAVFLYVGTMTKKTLDQHRYQETLLILPAKQPPPPPKVKIPPPPPINPPKALELKFDAPQITMPKPEPKPEPVHIEARQTAPTIKGLKQSVILAPQPKMALAPAAMPAQDNHVKPSTAPVHYGQTFGVLPNRNAKGPATVAAIGNPYGGMKGPAIAPHGVVGSTGIGDGVKYGNNQGRPGQRVASAGIPNSAVAAPSAGTGRVAAAGIPTAPTAVANTRQMTAGPAPTSIEVLSKPTAQYTSEAKQLKVQGDVILRVTFTANGKVIVQGVVHGLGHGLDEEARRVAQQIRFRPATRNGQAVDMTTNITITFQLA